MSIWVVGLNHKTAPLSIREKISFPETSEPLKALLSVDAVDEGLILSTCNRVELCVATHGTIDLPKQLVEFLSSYHGYHLDQLSGYLYQLNGEEAVHHTFRVASSLDSMVVGETQIFGQLKEAYERAKDARTLGPILHRFYHKAFSVAKRVRRETGIGAESISVGSVAVDLSQKIFDRLENKIILLVGAGEMIETAVHRFLEKGATQFYIANRSHENVVSLMQSVRQDAHFRSILLSEFVSYLDKIDMMLVSTSSPSYLITHSMMKEAMRRRKGRPIFCLDISVPRNVDPCVQDIENIYLYDIDDLEIIVKENVYKRGVEAKKAETIVMEEAKHFYQWLNSLKFTPTLKSIREKIEEIREKELAELFLYLPHLNKEERGHIEKFSKRFLNKMLHDPWVSIKEEVKSNNVGFVDFLKKLFRLP